MDARTGDGHTGRAMRVAACVLCLIPSLAAQSRPGATTMPVPQWLWDASPQDGEEVFFRRAFEMHGTPTAARLAVSCDNHCRVYVNGTRVGNSDAWEAPLVVAVLAQLREGDNVVAVHAWNDTGPAGLAVRLSWTQGDAIHALVSDAAWRCSDDDPDGWDEPGPPPPPPAPVLKLFEVPRAFGSWVSLACDADGRLYAGAQQGGLYRIAPASSPGGTTTVERVPVELDGAHGLLWFRGALYAVVNGARSGLYRLTDRDGDDHLDHVERLQALDGEGEHGPHSVVVAPDGEHLLVVCGNQTRLPPLAQSRVNPDWREDRLLPRVDDPHPYWEGISPPGGWVCRVDADGRAWELLTCGFRNPYDAAVRPNGEVVVFDADMEWDLGLPWYRPTRLLTVQDGIDYGWRIGSAKWPADYPEAPPARADIGPGSPTGMAMLGDHLLALDWTFGTVYLDAHAWLVGAPLPLCDVAVGPSATSLVTGGRGLPSAILRLPWGSSSPPAAAPPVATAPWPWPAEEVRTAGQILAEAERTVPGAPGTAPWSAARVALERLPVEALREIALAVDADHATRSLTGLLALCRRGGPGDLEPALAALGRLPFAPLTHLDRIAWLRAHALALLRLGPADDAAQLQVARRLLPLFPTGDPREDQDLAELLVHVDAPGLLDVLVPALTPLRPAPVPVWARIAAGGDVYGDQYGAVVTAMATAMPPVGQLAIADALRTVPHGWTLAQRRTYFSFLAAARARKGGSSYDGYIGKCIDAAWATCTPAEQAQLADVIGKARAPAPAFEATPPKGPGRRWQVPDTDFVLRDGLAGADVASGRNLFHAVGCAGCHYFAGEGGNHGPDLTSLANKFRARDVLEAILDPDKDVSDQYGGTVLTKHDGSTLFGFAVRGHEGDVEVWEIAQPGADPPVVRVPVAAVAKVARSPLSPMPAGLVDRLSAAELRDLLAFLLSRGTTRRPK